MSEPEAFGFEAREKASPDQVTASPEAAPPDSVIEFPSRLSEIGKYSGARGARARRARLSSDLAVEADAVADIFRGDEWKWLRDSFRDVQICVDAALKSAEDRLPADFEPNKRIAQ